MGSGGEVILQILQSNYYLNLTMVHRDAQYNLKQLFYQPKSTE